MALQKTITLPTGDAGEYIRAGVLSLGPRDAALHGLISAGGPAEAAAAPTGTFPGPSGAGRKMMNPHADRFRRRDGGRIAT
jgi:hypothetical protein